MGTARDKPNPDTSSASAQDLLRDLVIPGCILQAGTVNRVLDPNLTPENLGAFLSAHKGEDLYILAGVSPAKGTERARDEDVLKKNHFYLDFDIRNHYQKQHQETVTNAEIKDIADGIIQSLKGQAILCEWRYVVFTGNGIHIHYIGEPVDIGSLDHWRAGMRSLMQQAEACTGMPPDYGCVNVGRIARLPGSLNHKNKTPVRVEIIAMQDHKVGLSIIESIGKGSVQAAKQDAKQFAAEVRVKVSREKDVYSTIQNLPISNIVCRVQGWESRDGHFYEPGKRKAKACFVPKGENFIVHGGTDHFPPTQRGYSPFEFVKTTKELSNAETFTWFREQYLDIAAIPDSRLSLKGKGDNRENGNEEQIPDSRLLSGVNRDNRESGNTGFALQSIADLLAEPEESYDWVVQDMLPVGGISLSVAKPKVGKSTEARNLVLRVARGEPYLGRETKQGKVIYLAFEEKRNEVRRHFEQIGLRADDPVYLFIGTAPQHGMDALRKAIAEHQPLLVIVDPLFLLMPVKDVSDYAEITNRLNPLRALARDTGCHILATHHMGKRDRSEGDGVLGSTAIFGAVDTLIQLRKHGDSRVVQTIQRYGVDLPETVIKMDQENGQTVPAGDWTTLQGERIEKSVLDAIGDQELTETDIRDRTRGNQSLVSSALRRLYSIGLLLRSGEGVRGKPFRYKKVDLLPPFTTESPASDSPDEDAEH